MPFSKIKIGIFGKLYMTSDIANKGGRESGEIWNSEVGVTIFIKLDYLYKIIHSDG